MSLKCAVFHLAKWVGLFHLSRVLTRKRPLILCYHGISLRDEHSFRPKLFIRPEVLRQRLAWLKRSGYNVVTLQEAIANHEAGEYPRDARVLTIDDGFFGIRGVAAPMLKEHGFPCTVYVTTYYVDHANPIFRLVVQYMFWKTAESGISFDGLADGLDGGVRATKGPDGERAMWDIIRFAEGSQSEPERVALSQEIGRRLSVDYEELVRSRRLSLMTRDEIRELESFGLDVQLHTHRHRMPEDKDLLEREIQDNRRVLEPLASKPLRHFCYPSGEFTEEQWPTLEGLDVESGTTCISGMVSASVRRLGLPRVLDADNIPQIVFEAEICGLKSLLRGLLRRPR